MFFYNVTCFCYCLSLRTGGLILAVMGINGSLFAFDYGIRNRDYFEVFQGLGVFAYGSSIYAITKEKAYWMIPALIWASFSSVTVIPLINLIALVKYVAIPNTSPDQMSPETSVLMWLVKYMTLSNPPTDALTPEVIIVGIFACVAYVFIGALLWHFYFVLYGLYKEFKKLTEKDYNKSVVEGTNSVELGNFS